MTSSLAAHPQQKQFIARLLEMKEKDRRGDLAALKQRKLSPISDQKVKRLLGSCLPKNQWPREAYLLIAELLATYRLENTGEGNMGNHLAQVVKQSPQKRTGVERQLRDLTCSSRDMLPTRLRIVMGQMKGCGIPLNWLDLLVEVTAWGYSGCRRYNPWLDTFNSEIQGFSHNEATQGPIINLEQ